MLESDKYIMRGRITFSKGGGGGLGKVDKDAMKALHSEPGIDFNYQPMDVYDGVMYQDPKLKAAAADAQWGTGGQGGSGDVGRTIGGLVQWGLGKIGIGKGEVHEVPSAADGSSVISSGSDVHTGGTGQRSSGKMSRY